MKKDSKAGCLVIRSVKGIPNWLVPHTTDVQYQASWARWRGDGSAMMSTSWSLGPGHRLSVEKGGRGEGGDAVTQKSWRMPRAVRCEEARTQKLPVNVPDLVTGPEPTVAYCSADALWRADQISQRRRAEILIATCRRAQRQRRAVSAHTGVSGLAGLAGNGPWRHWDRRAKAPAGKTPSSHGRAPGRCDAASRAIRRAAVQDDGAVHSVCASVGDETCLAWLASARGEGETWPRPRRSREHQVRDQRFDAAPIAVMVAMSERGAPSPFHGPLEKETSFAQI